MWYPVTWDRLEAYSDARSVRSGHIVNMWTSDKTVGLSGDCPLFLARYLSEKYPKRPSKRHSDWWVVGSGSVVGLETSVRVRANQRHSRSEIWEKTSQGIRIMAHWNKSMAPSAQDTYTAHILFVSKRAKTWHICTIVWTHGANITQQQSFKDEAQSGLGWKFLESHTHTHFLVLHTHTQNVAFAMQGPWWGYTHTHT